MIPAVTRVGIGDYALGGPGDSYRATLGSCVGVCLLWPKRGRFALAHVLLPDSERGDEPGESRYADTVVPFLLRELGVGRHRREIVAYVAGGATMYETGDAGAQVGPANERFLLASLDELRVRVGGADMGGEVARQLVVEGPERRVSVIRFSEPATTKVWPFPPHFMQPKEAS